MRILHIIFGFRTGGAETMLVDILNAQAAMGHDVSLLIINDGVEQSLIDAIAPEVKVTHWPRRPGSRKLLLALRLNAWVRLQRPDLVHLHDPKLPGLLRGMDRRVIYTVHALNLSQQYLRPSVRQFAITETVRENVLEQNPAADVQVVTNGINIEQVRQRGSRLPDPANFRIVQSGRLDASLKGQDILIQALGILNRRGITGVSVDFIGDGPDRQMLQELAEKEGVANRVNFRGLMPRADVYQAYADYDLMVHPARYEGFGLIIAEAMAAGLPVAVPQDGGPYEVIRKGEFGATFAPESPEACADTIADVMNHYAEALTRATAARTFAATAYSIAHTAAAYLPHP